MFDQRKVKELVLASLVADSYCLSSHWIYDEEQLKTLKTDWESLGRACSIWHKGKQAGDFTHYGDQTYFLYQYALSHESFDIEEYMTFWKMKMEAYNGYIDAATRETLENINGGKAIPCGSASTDLSIVGRIAPLLMLSQTREAFLENVATFVQATHNSQQALESARFFATILVDVLEGCGIVEAIKERKDEFSTMIQSYIEEGLASYERRVLMPLEGLALHVQLMVGLQV